MSDAVLVVAFGRTDVGRVREENEDYLAIGDLDSGELYDPDELVEQRVSPRGPLIVVCDGMGGAAGGEVASELATNVVWAEMNSAQPTAERSVFARLLRRAVRVANRRVFEEGRKEPGLRGMGTTLSAAGVLGTNLILAQVGDSRAYLHRGETLTQVTRDQSIVSALVHAGRITPEEARMSAQANMILQALGVRDDLEVSMSLVELRRGDRLLMCSDGLYGPLGDDVLRDVMNARPNVRNAVDSLVESARVAGGPDNITAVVARFDGDALAEPSSEDDLPRFVELDTMEEGERALATTSNVARRLAARAGIVADPGGPVVPATGQHTSIQGDGPSLDASLREADLPGPATQALAERERVGLVVWVLAALVAVSVGALVLWGVI